MDSAITFSENETTWNVLCTDMSGYASIALAQAAGKTIWPSGAFSPGVYASHLILAVQTSADTATAGAGAFFAVNREDAGFADLATDADRDAVATPIFSGQTFSYPGVSLTDTIPISSVWCRKTAGTNLFSATAITG